MTPDERNAQRRERYAADPEFRAQVLAKNNESRKGTGKIRYRKELLKRHGDPEYDERRRQQRREAARRYYAKKRAEGKQ